MNEVLAYWCLSACLITIAITILMVALLVYGPNMSYRNRRTAELVWQAKNQNTDWWLEVERKDKPKP